MKFREYANKDKPACLSVFESNVPKFFAPHEKEQFEQWLDKTDRAPYFMLEHNGKVVACGGVYVDKKRDCVGLAWGMVANNQHSKGYGKALIEMRLALLKEQYSGKTIRNETSQHTVAFYEKFGFQTDHFEKDAFGNGIDKYLMSMPNP